MSLLVQDISSLATATVPAWFTTSCAPSAVRRAFSFSSLAAADTSSALRFTFSMTSLSASTMRRIAS